MYAISIFTTNKNAESQPWLSLYVSKNAKNILMHLQSYSLLFLQILPTKKQTGFFWLSEISLFPRTMAVFFLGFRLCTGFMGVGSIENPFASSTLFAWLYFRKVGDRACPCFCLLVSRGSGCTALPTLHIWPEPRPRALSQRVPDLLLPRPGAGTARLASQRGKGSQAVTSSRKSS